MLLDAVVNRICLQLPKGLDHEAALELALFCCNWASVHYRTEEEAKLEEGGLVAQRQKHLFERSMLRHLPQCSSLYIIK